MAQNRIHENQRAGIAIMGMGIKENVVQNDARGNNLSGLAPCLTFNLFEQLVGGNTWDRNLGTSNF